MFIGDILVFTNILLKKNHNEYTRPYDLLSTLYILDQEYYGRTGRFMIDDNSFEIWVNMNTFHFPRDLVYGKLKIDSRELNLIRMLNMGSHTTLYSDQFDIDNYNINIDFTTYRDSKGSPINIDVFKDIFSFENIEKKIMPYLRRAEYIKFPDARGYEASAYALREYGTSGRTMAVVKNSFREMEVNGALNGYVEKLSDAIDNRFAREQAEKEDGIFYPIEMRLDNSLFLTWFFKKIDKTSNIVFYNGFDKTGIKKIFDISARYARPHLTDEQYEAIYKESFSHPVKGSLYLRGERVEVKGNWKASANELELLMREGIAIEDDADFILDVNSLLSKNLKYLERISDPDYKLNQEISLFEDVFNGELKGNLKIKF